jgi:hypothetical protein
VNKLVCFLNLTIYPSFLLFLTFVFKENQQIHQIFLSNMSSSSGQGGGAMPAWKLRMIQREKEGLSGTPAPASSAAAASAPKGDIPKNSSTSSSSGGGANRNTTAEEARAKLKKKMEAAMLDPNLPSAFKVANANRLAFARQQARRKNNDTWVSLNSSHINQESTRPVDYVNADGDSDDESFASMADDDSFIEEGDEDDED